MSQFDHDVIVIGAGLAGAAATAQLVEAGFDVAVLEARERVGGRGFSRPLAGAEAGTDDDVLEFGGAWITPWHVKTRGLAKRHGLKLRPRTTITARRWLRDGAVTGDGPTSAEQRRAHEQALARVAGDTALLKAGRSHDEKGRPITGISFAAYLDRLSLPRATRDLFSAWWAVSGSGDKQAVAASEFLASCSYGDGLAEAMIDFWVETVSPGMSVLAERMIGDSGAALALAEPVASVARDADGVSVTTMKGRSLRARAAILALGVNQLGAVRFAPVLPPGKATAIATGHGGRAFKIWAKLRGVPVGTLVTGDGSGIELAFAERASGDGATLVVGFGIAGDAARPGDPEWVRAQLGRLFPNAQMLACDGHDWVADPWARGTWVSAYAGREPGLEPANWGMEGRLAFASSDIARDQAGWFEGAVISGEDAANAVERLLGGSPAGGRQGWARS